ncbi:MAG: DUF2071 domain-containing protein [Flavobacteriales bacterium]|nr:DUF2071 domain-containing protein [Flavobacteriales bacterium]
MDPSGLRAFVPAQLELDIHEGAAWVSIVAFTMHAADQAEGTARICATLQFPRSERAHIRAAQGQVRRVLPEHRGRKPCRMHAGTKTLSAAVPPCAHLALEGCLPVVVLSW